jgi:uncharacterized protein YeaO (DUF488 family)
MRAMSTRPVVRVRRVYEEPDPADGVRILVDRLWPRGVRKQDLAHDAWLKDVAPSGDLRTWYGHRPERFEEFARRYRKELRSGPPADALEQLRKKAGSRTLTLITATRDVERSGAAVLAETLREMGRPGRGRTRGALSGALP